MAAAACESCGWAAAVVSMLSFGSFGVPIKSETCQRLNIDPLVFQSYKSVVCFVSAAFVMVATSHPFRFTPWGIVSALFWVPGGVATVAAVKLAGLALAIAVGNSLIALVSFSWGIFFFSEPIHSKLMACVAVGMMVLGFSGMSYFSTRPSSASNQQPQSTTTLPVNAPLRPREQPLLESAYASPPKSSFSLQTCPSSGESVELVEEARRLHQVASKEIHDFESKTAFGADASEGGLRHRTHHHVLHHHSNQAVSSPRSDVVLAHSLQDSPALPIDVPNKDFFRILPQSANPRPCDVLLQLGSNGATLTRRQVGISLAVFNGCWGGSIMVPMKFCPDPTITSGIGYVWSFSIGAVVVTAVLWVMRFLWAWADLRSPTLAYKALPSLYFQEMWRPGGLSGLLWSIGNLFSILSVDYLGEGVGYCVCQASMLVSGLWGIFYFQEVKGSSTISKWFLSALMTVSGILLLSYEHHES